MSTKKILFFIINFIMLVHIAHAAAPKNDEFIEGIAEFNGGKEALLFTLRPVSGSDEIKVQYPGTNGKMACCLSASLVQKGQAKTNEMAMDGMQDRKVGAYRIRIKSLKPSADPFIGIAVIGENMDIQGAGEEVAVNKDGKKSLIKSCLSYEGVHVTRKAGGQELEHLYLGLGYDVEPTCDSVPKEGQ